MYKLEWTFMDSKKMYLANFNVTFGDKEEPLLSWLDEFVLPAMNSGIKRKVSEKLSYMFQNVEIVKYNDEYVLEGILIKDTILDIYNQLDEEAELIDTEQHPKSAPYSAFIVYLKNHRMVLVKRQSGSPDLRSFSATLIDVIKEYRRKENKIRRTHKESLLPYMVCGIKGIKNEKDIQTALKDVKRIKKLTLKVLPQNNEIGGLYGIIDGLQEELRKKSQSKALSVVVTSPNSKKGVEEIIKSTENLVEVSMDVEYYSDGIDSDGKERKRTGKIKDSDISQTMDIQITDDLKENISDIYEYCTNIDSLHVNTANIEDYKKYINKRKE